LVRDPREFKKLAGIGATWDREGRDEDSRAIVVSRSIVPVQLKSNQYPGGATNFLENINCWLG